MTRFRARTSVGQPPFRSSTRRISSFPTAHFCCHSARRPCGRRAPSSPVVASCAMSNVSVFDLAPDPSRLGERLNRPQRNATRERIATFKGVRVVGEAVQQRMQRRARSKGQGTRAWNRLIRDVHALPKSPKAWLLVILVEAN